MWKHCFKIVCWTRCYHCYHSTDFSLFQDSSVQLPFWEIVCDTRVTLMPSCVLLWVEHVFDYNNMFYVESMYDIIMRFPFKVILFNLMSFFWMFSGGTMFIIFKVCSPHQKTICSSSLHSGLANGARSLWTLPALLADGWGRWPNRWVVIYPN